MVLGAREQEATYPYPVLLPSERLTTVLGIPHVLFLGFLPCVVRALSLVASLGFFISTDLFSQSFFFFFGL